MPGEKIAKILGVGKPYSTGKKRGTILSVGLISTCLTYSLGLSPFKPFKAIREMLALFGYYESDIISPGHLV